MPFKMSYLSGLKILANKPSGRMPFIGAIDLRNTSIYIFILIMNFSSETAFLVQIGVGFSSVSPNYDNV